MVARDPNLHLERDPAAGVEDESVDYELLKDTVGFILRSPRRRPKLAAIVFGVTAALGLTAAAIMPRVYNAQVKLLAQVNLVVPALSNPNRAVPRDADSPTKNASDQILRRDNLVALTKASNLVSHYYGARSRLLKLKDSILGGAETAEDKQRVVVVTLEKKLSVTTQENNVIISLDWYDPNMTYELVTLVQKNFLEARYDDEVAMISDAIAVIQEHAKTEADELDQALDEYQKLTVAQPPSRATDGAPSGTQRAPARPAPGAVASATLASAPSIDPELTAMLEEKRHQIQARKEERQRELDSLRTQLEQAQLTLTPHHPTVVVLQQKLDGLSAPDEALAPLKAEERVLMAKIASALAGASAPSTAPASPLAAPRSEPFSPTTLPAAAALAPQPAASREEDARTKLARSKLEGAIRRYQESMARIDAANMELEIARTAFKYRYTVVTPAEVPRSPKSPIATLVALGSLLGAALLAMLASAGPDWWSGLILEEWQVRRRLKLEVLGEFDPSAAPPSRLT